MLAAPAGRAAAGLGKPRKDAPGDRVSSRDVLAMDRPGRIQWRTSPMRTTTPLLSFLKGDLLDIGGGQH